MHIDTQLLDGRKKSFLSEDLRCLTGLSPSLGNEEQLGNGISLRCGYSPVFASRTKILPAPSLCLLCPPSGDPPIPATPSEGPREEVRLHVLHAGIHVGAVF